MEKSANAHARKILLLDNFDSFTFNIVQTFQVLGAEVIVRRAQTSSVESCLELSPSHIVIGPGPGDPSSAGISLDLIRSSAGKIPILGVCLGHQAIGQHYGATVARAGSGPMHGKTSRIRHTNQGVFRHIPQDFQVVRYHSLTISPQTLPEILEITAVAEDGEIMGLRHKMLPIEGVQFHPESILTDSGMLLFENFLTGA